MKKNGSLLRSGRDPLAKTTHTVEHFLGYFSKYEILSWFTAIVLLKFALLPGYFAHFEPNEHIRRTTITSSCGICGKDSISNLLHIHGPPLSESIRVNQQDVSKAVTALREHQASFDLTGGSHACARVLPGGGVIDAHEDIGRHNAMDKLVGNAVKLGHTPITDEMVVVSGRASFELVQKSLRAGFPVFISVGAPSSLAVDLANEHRMTLICFAAETRMTVFSGSGRVEMPQSTDFSA